MRKPPPFSLAKMPPALPGYRAGLLRDRSDIQDVDDQQITGLGTFDGEGARELVHHGQVAVADVVGVIGVDDGAVEPLLGFDAEAVARLHRCHRGNIGMPSVVPDQLLLPERLALVDGKDHIRHPLLPRVSKTVVGRRVTELAGCGAAGRRSDALVNRRPCPFVVRR